MHFQQCFHKLTISKASNAIHGRHFDDKGKHVINEGVESFVREHTPWKMSYRLELIVDEQLRSESYGEVIEESQKSKSFELCILISV